MRKSSLLGLSVFCDKQFYFHYIDIGPHLEFHHRGNASGGVDVAPEQGIDTIVSYKLEEPGSHILRVEVGYVAATDGNVKTFRKFYRFQVSQPLTVHERTVRADEESCIVAVSVEFTGPEGNSNASNVSALTICSAEFHPVDGLSAERIGSVVSNSSRDLSKESALEMLDNCGRLEAGHCYQYIFKVKTESRNASIRGIAAGDELGKAVFMWSKAMGETGRIASSTIHCPAALDISKLSLLAGNNAGTAGSRSSYDDVYQDLTNDKDFVVQRSGLSVDVAAASARRASANGILPYEAPDQFLPVTVEAIRPPSRMQLATPHELQFLVMNHTNNALSLQLQFRYDKQRDLGLTVCGHSFKNLGELSPQGGCKIVNMRFSAISAGLLRLHGCYIVDLATDREIAQPPLFDVFVDSSTVQQDLTDSNTETVRTEIAFT